MTYQAALTRMLETSWKDWEQQMQTNELDIAMRAVRLFAETHPRPTHVTMTQAGEMLGLTRQTVSKLVHAGKLKLNGCGLIPIEQIDMIRAAASA
ncbi:MAG: DNA-binding protein [Ralstonia mannitolilytica]